MAWVYYNECDPQAAEWLRCLIDDMLIPNGVVDERPIQKVEAWELEGYDQHHFFAGIGGWPLALRLAGWPDDRPVWTGSCPCQPFSAAGKRKAQADDRHIWPDFFRLIRECRPECVFGEQVEGAIRHGWLDGVCADLEGEGYAVGSCVLGAHSVGAPHIRQRLYWVADRQEERHGRRTSGAGERGEDEPERLCYARGVAHAGHAAGSGDDLRAGEPDARGGRGTGGLEHPASNGREQGRAETGGRGAAGGRGDGCGVGDPDRAAGERLGQHGVCALRDEAAKEHRAPGPGFWADSVWIDCRDGKRRRVPSAQPGVLPVADGLPPELDDERYPCGDRFPLAGAITGRVALLRGAGNAIVPQAAAAFIGAYLETIQE